MKVFKKLIIAISAIIVAAILFTFIFPEKIYNVSLRIKYNSAGLERKEISTGDQRFVYLEGGKGSETLVLLHGFGADKNSWPTMVKILAGYHYIIPDLPGFGESSRSASDKYDIVSQAERLDKFLVKLGVTNFYIAGNSMGGNIAGVYAARYPRKVKALILLDALGVNSPVKSVVAKSIEKGVNPLLVGSREEFNRLMDLLFVKKQYIPYPVEGVMTARSMRNRDFNAKIFKDMMDAPAMFEDNFKTLAMPTLIIWGDKDQLLDVSSVPVLEKGIKNHTTRILKDCGHVPMMERPEETAGYIKSFIQSVK